MIAMATNRARTITTTTSSKAKPAVNRIVNRNRTRSNDAFKRSSHLFKYKFTWSWMCAWEIACFYLLFACGTKVKFWFKLFFSQLDFNHHFLFYQLQFIGYFRPVLFVIRWFFDVNFWINFNTFFLLLTFKNHFLSACVCLLKFLHSCNLFTIKMKMKRTWCGRMRDFHANKTILKSKKPMKIGRYGFFVVHKHKKRKMCNEMCVCILWYGVKWLYAINRKWIGRYCRHHR